ILPDDSLAWDPASLASSEPYAARGRAQRLVYIKTSAARVGSHASHLVGHLVHTPRADRAGLDTRPRREGSCPSPVADPQGGRGTHRREATRGVSHPGASGNVTVV